jgi:hypothetical protein
VSIDELPDGTLIRREPDPFSAGQLAKRNRTTYTDEVLGNAPPGSLDSVMSGLVRVHRHFQQDDDSETRQSNGYWANQVTDARLSLLRSLIAWLKPAVDAERAAWDAIDRDLDKAKDTRWPG